MSGNETITELLGLQGWEVMENGVQMETNEVFVSIRRRTGNGYRCKGVRVDVFGLLRPSPYPQGVGPSGVGAALLSEVQGSQGELSPV